MEFRFHFCSLLLVLLPGLTSSASGSVFVPGKAFEYELKLLMDERYSIRDAAGPVITKDEIEKCKNAQLIAFKVLSGTKYKVLQKLRWRAANECCRLRGKVMVTETMSKSLPGYKNKVDDGDQSTDSHSEDAAWTSASNVINYRLYEWQSGEDVALGIWGPGEPNNRDAQGRFEGCGQLFYDTYINRVSMNDWSCFNENYFICEDETPVMWEGADVKDDELNICRDLEKDFRNYGGRYYHQEKVAVRWKLADKCCKLHGLQLISLDDEDDTDYKVLAENIHASDSGRFLTWTSGNDLEETYNYKWQTGESIYATGNYSAEKKYCFFQNYPQMYHPNRHCIQIRFFKNVTSTGEMEEGLRYRNVQCGLLRDFICERQKTLQPQPKPAEPKSERSGNNTTTVAPGKSLLRSATENDDPNQQQESKPLWNESPGTNSTLDLNMTQIPVDSNINKTAQEDFKAFNLNSTPNGDSLHSANIKSKESSINETENTVNPKALLKINSTTTEKPVDLKNNSTQAENPPYLKVNSTTEKPAVLQAKTTEVSIALISNSTTKEPTVLKVYSTSEKPALLKATLTTTEQLAVFETNSTTTQQPVVSKTKVTTTQSPVVSKTDSTTTQKPAVSNVKSMTTEKLTVSKVNPTTTEKPVVIKISSTTTETPVILKVISTTTEKPVILKVIATTTETPDTFTFTPETIKPADVKVNATKYNFKGVSAATEIPSSFQGNSESETTKSDVEKNSTDNKNPGDFKSTSGSGIREGFPLRTNTTKNENTTNLKEESKVSENAGDFQKNSEGNGSPSNFKNKTTKNSTDFRGNSTPTYEGKNDWYFNSTEYKYSVGSTDASNAKYKKPDFQFNSAENKTPLDFKVTPPTVGRPTDDKESDQNLFKKSATESDQATFKQTPSSSEHDTFNGGMRPFSSERSSFKEDMRPPERESFNVNKSSLERDSFKGSPGSFERDSFKVTNERQSNEPASFPTDSFRLNRYSMRMDSNRESFMNAESSKQEYFGANGRSLNNQQNQAVAPILTTTVPPSSTSTVVESAVEQVNGLRIRRSMSADNAGTDKTITEKPNMQDPAKSTTKVWWLQKNGRPTHLGKNQTLPESNKINLPTTTSTIATTNATTASTTTTKPTTAVTTTQTTTVATTTKSTTLAATTTTVLTNITTTTPTTTTTAPTTTTTTKVTTTATSPTSAPTTKARIPATTATTRLPFLNENSGTSKVIGTNAPKANAEKIASLNKTTDKPNDVLVESNANSATMREYGQQPPIPLTVNAKDKFTEPGGRSIAKPDSTRVIFEEGPSPTASRITTIAPKSSTKSNDASESRPVTVMIKSFEVEQDNTEVQRVNPEIAFVEPNADTIQEVMMGKSAKRRRKKKNRKNNRKKSGEKGSTTVQPVPVVDEFEPEKDEDSDETFPTGQVPSEGESRGLFNLPGLSALNLG